MKETEGSLRAYFLFAGAISAFFGFRELAEVTKIDGLPGDWAAALYLQTVSRAVIGIAFVLAGIKLKAALRAGPGWILKLLIVSGVMLVVNVIFMMATFGTTFGNQPLVWGVIGIAITIYLYRSVTRLSAEAIAKPTQASNVA